MITNLTRFKLPVALFFTRYSVSAEAQIVPAPGEPIQPIPVDTVENAEPGGIRIARNRLL